MCPSLNGLLYLDGVLPFNSINIFCIFKPLFVLVVLQHSEAFLHGTSLHSLDEHVRSFLPNISSSVLSIKFCVVVIASNLLGLLFYVFKVLSFPGGQGQALPSILIVDEHLHHLLSEIEEFALFPLVYKYAVQTILEEIFPEIVLEQPDSPGLVRCYSLPC